MARRLTDEILDRIKAANPALAERIPDGCDTIRSLAWLMVDQQWTPSVSDESSIARRLSGRTSMIDIKFAEHIVSQMNEPMLEQMAIYMAGAGGTRMPVTKSPPKPKSVELPDLGEDPFEAVERAEKEREAAARKLQIELEARKAAKRAAEAERARRAKQDAKVEQTNDIFGSW